MPRSPAPAGQASRVVLLIEDLNQQRLPARALAAVLRRAGFEAQLIPFGSGRGEAAEDARQILARARQLQPRLILFSVLFASGVREYLSLAEALRQAGIGAHITMAGPLPAFVPAELLSACRALDSVLCGEAETAIVALAEGLHDPERPPALPGLAYRGPGGAIQGPDGWAAPVADLDSLPFPAMDEGVPSYLGYGFATVEGSRGCYHACSFCLPGAFYRRCGGSPYRLRSIPNLVDEIETLYRQGAQLFLFDDEQFLPPKGLRARRIADFEQELARRGLEIAFTIKCRADDVEDDLFRRLQGMGLLRVYVGIESGCQASLDLFHKGVTVARNASALGALARLGIVADFHNLLFHPLSTLETVEADIAFCRRALPDVSTPLRFSEVGIFPGTALAGRLEREGRLTGEPWRWCYALADERAEVLRRLNRVVFIGSAPCAQVERLVSDAWYALLLERRFRPARFDDARADRLRGVVARLNAERLAVWDEMVALARAGKTGNPAQVNVAAGRWAERVNTACMRAAGLLAEAGLAPGSGSEAEVLPVC